MFNVVIGNQFIRMTKENIKSQGLEIKKTGSKIYFNYNFEDLYEPINFNEFVKVSNFQFENIEKYEMYNIRDYIFKDKKMTNDKK